MFCIHVVPHLGYVATTMSVSRSQGRLRSCARNRTADVSVCHPLGTSLLYTLQSYALQYGRAACQHASTVHTPSNAWSLQETFKTQLVSVRGGCGERVQSLTCVHTRERESSFLLPPAARQRLPGRNPVSLSAKA